MLTRKQKITLYVMLGVGACVAIYDICVAATDSGSNTISWVILALSRDYPAIPFGFGFLMGHFFAGQHGIEIVSETTITK